VSATVAPATRPAARGLPFWANQRVGLVLLIVVLAVVFGALRPVFFNEKLVLFPMLRDVATFTVVGLSQMAVLSIGHLNLAVGRMAAFGAMFTGMTYDLAGLGLVPGILAALCAGLAIGALTGWIIARSGVHSFIVTLAMDFALLGLVTLVYTGLTEVAAFTEKPEGLRAVRSNSLDDVCVGGFCGPSSVPWLLGFTLVALVGVGYLFRSARLGRELLMVGSNERAARLSGVPTVRRVIAAHALSGLLAGLAGFMLGATTGSFKATIGEEFLLTSFLGPVLGGTLLVGGTVSTLGTFLGTLLVAEIRRGLDLLQVGLENLNLYLGVILLLAISAQRLRAVLSQRRAVR